MDFYAAIRAFLMTAFTIVAIILAILFIVIIVRFSPVIALAIVLLVAASMLWNSLYDEMKKK